MEQVSLDYVLDLAHKLPRTQRAELIARLAIELAVAEPPTERPRLSPDEARAALAEIREHFRAQGPVSPSMSEQLDADRRSRDASLRGEV